jgi:dTDP-glucose pyrophosphorylase
MELFETKYNKLLDWAIVSKFINMEFTNYLIDENVSLIYALKLIDTLPHKILFVLKSQKLVGSVTDGDIRRWIINNGDLNSPIIKLANLTPKFLSYSYYNDKSRLLLFANKHSINAVPLVDDDFTVKDIYFIEMELPKIINEKVTIVIMAGGLGTRLYPYTKVLPKPLKPVGDLPITEIIMDKFATHGLINFILLLNHKKNMIKSYFNDLTKGYSIEYVDEDIPLGTGGGLTLLKGKISPTFILSNCDILIQDDFYKIFEYHKKNGNFITIVASLKTFKIPYGVIEPQHENNNLIMKEKPELTYLVNTGVYIVNHSALDFIRVNENIGFPSVIQRIQQAGKKIGIFPISEDKWFDMGQVEDLEKMRNNFNGIK